jgi:uncharacterized protein YkwD
MKRLGPILLILSLGSPLLSAADSDAPDSRNVTAAAIVHEMNLARQNPSLYATFLEQTRQNYSGRLCLVPGNVRTHEGVRAVDDAIRFLRNTQPRLPLALSPGLCLAAADHCREQAAGAIGHTGCDGGNPGIRMARPGVAAQAWAENISYGRRSARDIIMALIIDDGVRGRGHRKNIFNPNYTVAGAAYGPHARYSSVCSIDFTSGYGATAFVRTGINPANSF